MLLCCSTQAETRAEFAERSVAKLEKTIDDLEGMITFLLKSLFHLEVLSLFTKYKMDLYFSPPIFKSGTKSGV